MSWTDCTACRCSTEDLIKAGGCPALRRQRPPVVELVDAASLGPVSRSYRGPERRIPLDSSTLRRVVYALLLFWMLLLFVVPAGLNLVLRSAA
jgi:hypothetical protein